MAERRMFAKSVVDSDAFLDMPMSTQCLYFHLSMRADDDGFLNNARKIQRMIGASDDDMKVLLTKRFILPFESGVVVIKHWKIHNYIRNDRYKPTIYAEEKSLLAIKENGAYTEAEHVGIPSDNQVTYQLETQVRLGKDRLGKESIDSYVPDTKVENTQQQKRSRSKPFEPPTVEDVAAYCKERMNDVDAERFVDFYEAKGWMLGKNKMKDWKAAVRTWERTNKNQNGRSGTNGQSERNHGTAPKIGTYV